jgi:hypothetical protein
MSYEIEDSLTFYECPYNPHRSSKEIFVTNQDNHIYHSIEDTTIRFFTVTKIGTQGKKKQNINFANKLFIFLAPKYDPCDSSPCHGFAQCIPNFEQNSYECKCNSGFIGDGIRRCDGKNEILGNFIFEFFFCRKILMNVFNHHVIQMLYVQIHMEILHVNVNEIILEMDFFVNQLMMKVRKEFLEK